MHACRVTLVTRWGQSVWIPTVARGAVWAVSASLDYLILLLNGTLKAVPQIVFSSECTVTLVTRWSQSVRLPTVPVARGAVWANKISIVPRGDYRRWGEDGVNIGGDSLCLWTTCFPLLWEELWHLVLKQAAKVWQSAWLCTTSSNSFDSKSSKISWLGLIGPILVWICELWMKKRMGVLHRNRCLGQTVA